MSIQTSVQGWPQLTKEEAEFISQKPWTKEIGDFIDKLVYDRLLGNYGNWRADYCGENRRDRDPEF